MIKENLLKVADYLDSDKVEKFDMRDYASCVVGHGCRIIEGREGYWNCQWVQGATMRIFGIPSATPTAEFLFSANWTSDPKMAAVRLRYVALHGEAPSYDQWERFRYVLPPWKKYEQKPAESEPLGELEEEMVGCA
jgi:hypothetical protein